MRAKKKVILTVLILCCVSPLPAEKTSIWQGIKPATGPRDLGIIFNTNDILLDIESYQGGLGAKIGLDKWTLRLMVDFRFNKGINPFYLSLGGVLEKQILPGPVSVYWGPSLDTGFSILTDKIDDDNWNQYITLELASLGGLFGIELFVFESLSIFVEYNLALTLGVNIDRVSVAGSVSSLKEFTYTFNLGLGNNAMFGIVFYLTRRE